MEQGESEARLQAEVQRRQQAEERLATFRRFVDDATQGFGIVDLEGQIIYANPFLADLLGAQAPEDLLGAHMSAFYPADSVQYLETDVSSLLSEQQHWQGELLMRFADGTLHPTIHSVFPILDDGGRLFCVGAVVTDITEVKRTQEALHQSDRQVWQSEGRYAALIECCPDAVAMIDLSGRILFASERALELHGFQSSDDVIGMPAVDLISAADRERYLASKCCLIEQGVHRNIEYTMLRKDGSTFEVEMSSAVMPDVAGETEAMMAVYRDITARQRAERDLRAKDAELLAVAEIQASLLPQESPHVPGFDIAGECYPAQVAAGDHFDYLRRPDGSWLLVMGDVSGHGIGPAIVAADFCARLRTLSESPYALPEMAVKVNGGLFRETGGEIFVTAILGRLDPERRALTCLNAGHPPALVLDAAGETKAWLTEGGFPFAILPETPYVAGEPLALSDGDVILLYTDGLVEAGPRGAPQFGIARAMEVVRDTLDRPAQEIVEALHHAVCCYAGSDPPCDDITVMVIKVLARVPAATPGAGSAERGAASAATVADGNPAGRSVARRHFDVERCDRVTIVRLVDARYFDTEDYTLLHEGLLSFVDSERPRKLVIDLASLAYLSTALISTLLIVQKCVRARGGSMRLSGLNRHMLEALEHLRLVGTLFSVYPDEAAAREAF